MTPISKLSFNDQAHIIQQHQQIQKILLIKWSAMGDCVLISGLLDDLRAHFPHAQLHLNIQPPWDQLFSDDPRFDQLISLRLKGQGLNAYWRWLSILKKERYDLIIDCQFNDRSKILLQLARCCGFGGRYRVGLGAWAGLYHFYPDQPQQLHAYDRSVAALAKFGINIRTRQVKLHIPESIKIAIEQRAQALQLLPEKTVIFFPGCSPNATAKRWSTQHFIALAKLLLASNCERIILIGAQDEMAVCQEIAQTDPEHIINLCNHTQLLDIPMWCQYSHAIFSNDTGAAHLASMTDIPLFVFFGPTAAYYSQPIGSQVFVQTHSLPCQPCFKKQCSHQSCLQLISPQRVFQSYLQKITKKAP